MWSYFATEWASMYISKRTTWALVIQSPGLRETPPRSSFSWLLISPQDFGFGEQFHGPPDEPMQRVTSSAKLTSSFVNHSIEWTTSLNPTEHIELQESIVPLLNNVEVRTCFVCHAYFLALIRVNCDFQYQSNFYYQSDETRSIPQWVQDFQRFWNAWDHRAPPYQGTQISIQSKMFI